MAYLIFVFVLSHFLCIGYSCHSGSIELESDQSTHHSLKLGKNVVLGMKEIKLDQFPAAYNPSLFKINSGYLLSFRYTPHKSMPWISYIGVVLLNHNFDPISNPELLKTREKGSITPSQAEDARLFSFRNELYLIYNDNLEITNPTQTQRREMFISRLLYEDDHFVFSSPTRMFHEERYSNVLWEKNWVPFEWNEKLLLIYSIKPHEILYPDLAQGVCIPIYKTAMPVKWEAWKWGKQRGSTPAQPFNNEYLSFFHSSIEIHSTVSGRGKKWHYYMGAYTFSAEPPFEIIRATESPITANGFYTKSECDKRVIYPGSFVISDSNIYIAIGKDDCRMFIVTIDKEGLEKMLIPLK